MKRGLRRRLEGLTPRGAPKAVRNSVLDGIGRELEASSGSRSEWVCGLGIAASILLAFALNLCVDSIKVQRIASLIEPLAAPTDHRPMAGSHAVAIDDETAVHVTQSFPRAKRASMRPDEYRRLIESWITSVERWSVKEPI